MQEPLKIKEIRYKRVSLAVPTQLCAKHKFNAELAL